MADTYSRAAAAFVEVAHGIVWCTIATVDPLGRPRSRVMHPIWEWDGPDAPAFVVLRLRPWRLWVRPFARVWGGETADGLELLSWTDPDAPRRP